MEIPSAYPFLDDADVLIVNKALAKAIGLNLSITFRQIRYWLKLNEKSDNKGKYRDKCWWTFNTYQQWKEDNFDFWSEHTVRRNLVELRSLGLVYTSSEYNTRKGDQTLWYTINYGGYAAFIKLWTDHGAPQCGEGRPSVEYTAFLEDWKGQMGNYTSLPSCVDQVSNLDRASAQLGQTVTRDYTEDNTEIKDQSPTATAKRLSKGFDADNHPGVKGDEVTPSKKKSKESALAKKISSVIGYGQPLSMQLSGLIIEQSKKYDEDPIYQKFIDEIVAPKFSFQSGDKRVMVKRETAVDFILAGAGWEQYEAARRPEYIGIPDEMFEDPYGFNDL